MRILLLFLLLLAPFLGHAQNTVHLKSGQVIQVVRFISVDNDGLLIDAQGMSNMRVPVNITKQVTINGVTYSNPTTEILRSAITSIPQAQQTANPTAQTEVPEHAPMPSDEECAEFLTVSVDEMTGDTTRVGVIEGENASGKWVFVIASKIVLVQQKVRGESNCIDQGSPIWFKFHDGTLLKLASIKKFNCDGYFTLVAISGTELYIALKTKKLVMMRCFTHQNTQTDFAITESQAQMIQGAAKCMLKPTVRK